MQALREEMPRVKHFICISEPLEEILAYEKLLEGKSPPLKT